MSYKRVLVYLVEDGSSRLVNFTECVVHRLKLENNAGLVNCRLRFTINRKVSFMLTVS